MLILGSSHSKCKPTDGKLAFAYYFYDLLNPTIVQMLLFESLLRGRKEGTALPPTLHCHRKHTKSWRDCSVLDPCVAGRVLRWGVKVDGTKLPAEKIP